MPPNAFNTNYSQGQGKVDNLLKTYVPEAAVAVVLVNSEEFGAATVPGRLSVLSTSTNQVPLADTVLHELGHSLALLGDEYDTAFPQFQGPEEPNTTRQTNRNSIKWKAWIDSATPIPTPETTAYQNAVGLFEGAHYNSKGWYRPKLDCRMKTLNKPYCPGLHGGACALILCGSLFPQQLPPVPGTISITNTQPVSYHLDILQPSNHGISVKWFLNGLPVAGETDPNFDFSASGRPNGTYVLRAEMRDKPAWSVLTRLVAGSEHFLDQSSECPSGSGPHLPQQHSNGYWTSASNSSRKCFQVLPRQFTGPTQLEDHLDQ